MLLGRFGNVDESPDGPVVSAVQNLAEDQLTWEAATARLLQEYESRRSSASSGPHISRETSSSIRALKSMARVRCFRWTRFGHYKRNCKAVLGPTEFHNGSQRDQDSAKRALVTCHRRLGVQFVADSGASLHMVHSGSVLTNVRPATVTEISTGDGTKLTSRNRGTASAFSKEDNGTGSELSTTMYF